MLARHPIWTENHYGSSAITTVLPVVLRPRHLIALNPRLRETVVSTKDSDLTIEAMTASDWPSIRAIYLEGIATGDATFEQTAPDWDRWNAGHLETCRLVARMNSRIVGWAALSAVSSRCVYRGVAEVSIYVSGDARGQRIGSHLLEKLVAESERAGFWTLQAGIFPENVSSIRLHERAGFRMVGLRERLGNMNGRWRDVVLLERRSASVGMAGV
jgi:L-amino acid N-acyltransferase YncA